MNENDLRNEAIRLKIEVLKVQATKMGLKEKDEGISAASLKKIEESVAGMNLQQLQEEVAHWKILRSRLGL